MATAQSQIRRGKNGSRSVKKALAKLETGEALALPSYAVAALPAAASNSGRIVHCTNGAAGSPCLAYSNGTSWLRVLLGAAVAIS